MKIRPGHDRGLAFTSWLRHGRILQNCGSLLICLYLLGVTVQINRLNRLAGGVLPQVPTSGGANQKWRVADPTLHEKHLRAEVLRENGDSDVGEVLLNADLARNLAEYRLQDLVEGHGLLQYPVSLLAMVMGSIGFVSGTRSRLVSLTLMLAGLVSLCQALLMDYWVSLSW